MLLLLLQVTNIFSNCDSTIMGNSSNKEKDKELNGINIPKVSRNESKPNQILNQKRILPDIRLF